MSWDGRTNQMIDTRFTYDRDRLRSALTDDMTWPTAEQEQEPDFTWDHWQNVRRERTAEVYAYNVFGERIGVYHCTALFPSEYPGLPCHTCYGCSKRVRVYDYVDGRLLVERESDTHDGPNNRFISVYTWGPMGLIARQGVSVRNGYWDPAGGALCDPEHPELGTTGAFVDENPDAMQAYTYMADHMGLSLIHI